MKDPIVIEATAPVIIELENAIKDHIDNIAKLKDELKKKREMLQSALLNDETYRLHNEEAKKAAKIKANTKFQILLIQGNKKLAEDVKELSSQVKEADGALSDYLREYNRMTGSDEIEAHDGKRWTIVKKYKITSAQQRMF